MRVGLLLPHFGEFADTAKVVAGSVRAERLGFASVWVRDHLLFTPHGEFEKPDATFYEALTVLTVVGANTTALGLGTGALIPFRHPLPTAVTLSTMTQFFGPRLTIGFGAGNFDNEFAAVNLAGWPRQDLVRESVQIMRAVWTGDGVSHEAEPYRFSDVSLRPRPVGGPIPLWYCGATPRSARLAAEFGDGWLPGRISLPTLRSRVRLLHEEAARNGRPVPAVGIIPTTSVDRDPAAALARVNVEGLLAWANNSRYWVTPPSGRFETVADLAGVLLHGTPADLVDQIGELGEVGVDEVVLDFRLTFDRWEEQMELVGAEVIPKLGGAG